MFFKKKSKNTNQEVIHEKGEEILFVAKTKYNRFEKDLRQSVFPQLKRVCEQANIKIKNIKIDSRIGEYDQVAVELITGLFYQMAHKLNREEVVIGSLEIKINKNNVDIQGKHIQSQVLRNLIGRRYNAGFGLWSVIEGNGIHLMAHFDKDKYAQYVNESRQRQSGERRHV